MSKNKVVVPPLEAVNLKWNRLHPAIPFHLSPMVWRIEFEVVQ